MNENQVVSILKEIEGLNEQLTRKTEEINTLEARLRTAQEEKMSIKKARAQRLERLNLIVNVAPF